MLRDGETWIRPWRAPRNQSTMVSGSNRAGAPSRPRRQRHQDTECGPNRSSHKVLQDTSNAVTLGMKSARKVLAIRGVGTRWIGDIRDSENLSRHSSSRESQRHGCMSAEALLKTGQASETCKLKMQPLCMANISVAPLFVRVVGLFMNLNLFEGWRSEPAPMNVLLFEKLSVREQDTNDHDHSMRFLDMVIVTKPN